MIKILFKIYARNNNQNKSCHPSHTDVKENALVNQNQKYIAVDLRKVWKDKMGLCGFAEAVLW